MIRAYDSAAIRAAEEPLLAAGVPLMREAAHALALRAVRVLNDDGARVPGSVALALVGGGNNGGDALFAAAELARRGLTVFAALCAADVHEEGLAAARAAGVRVRQIVGEEKAIDSEALIRIARRSGIWIDGLAGIGLAGPLRDPLASIVEALGEEKDSSPDEPVVIAVDVPSGVGGDGAVRGPLLRADITVTMGAPKAGLLLPPAAEFAGEVEVVELGLPLAGAEHRVERLTGADVADLYPWPRRNDHKYTRGVVGLWTGSERYPGAAALSVGGALAAGPGMVRYLGSANGLPWVYPEAVTAEGRIQAAVVGSGMDDPGQARAALDEALSRGVPVVVDAGGLAELGPALEKRVDPAPIVATPHAGELASLLGISRRAVESHPVLRARELAEKWGVVVLLKGPISVIAPPEGPLLTQEGETPWLATAGSGDVLAGITGTILALAQARAEEEGGALRDADVARLAAASVWLHARAGLRAATHAGGSGPIRAGDIARALPGVLAECDR
ncbi:MAG: NAD(P)H-hydrate dehydratase [bacterium]|nr:NAD(P)H-hydrate dehydratase [bacterium]